MNRVRRYQTNRKRSEEMKEKYPVLIGHSARACKKLFTMEQVASTRRLTPKSSVMRNRQSSS